MPQAVQIVAASVGQASALPMPRHWLLIGGVARECARWGDAPQLLLRQLRQLDPAAQLHLVDLPGTGALWERSCPRRVEEMVEQLRGRCGRLERPYGLIAGSLSAPLASHWAHAHGREVGHLLLLNPVLRPFTPLLRALRPRLWPTLAALLLGRRSPLSLDERLFATTTFQRSDVMGLAEDWQRLQREHPVKLRNALAQGLAVWRYHSSRRHPQAQVLLLAGRRDQWYDWRSAQAISRAWGAALKVHPQAGHDLLLDDPVWVCKALGEWLALSGRVSLGIEAV